MKPASEVVALVIDHGRFLPVARRLAKDFAKVYYWSPWEGDTPSLKTGLIGSGFDDIERVSDPMSVVRVSDLLVFPDIGFAPMQQYWNAYLPTWGHMGTDVLEVNRGRFLKKLEEIGLPVPVYRAIEGMEALRGWLRGQEDKYIKISKWRGDWETFHWRSWEESIGELDRKSVEMGPARELVTFYVFDPIDSEIEDGYDGYCIDGRLPSVCIHGMEKKDKTYLGTFCSHSDLPEPVRQTAEAFSKVLGEYGYRSFFSTEVRITEDGTPYFIDPTLRAGSPPHQVQCEMISNYGEVIWNGANGILVDPEPASQFVVQALVDCGCDGHEWLEIVVPEELEQWLKVGFAFRMGNKLCITPDKASHAVWLTAVGDSIKEAIENLKEKAKLLPEHCECRYEGLVDLLKEVEEAEKRGMEFTPEPVPKPESVMK